MAHLSEPARSTKDSLPLVTFWVCKLVASMITDMTRCERDDSRFICTKSYRFKPVIYTCYRAGLAGRGIPKPFFYRHLLSMSQS